MSIQDGGNHSIQFGLCLDGISPRGLSGFYWPELPYTGFDGRSVISGAHQGDNRCARILIAAGLASSLITVWIALVEMIA